MWGNASYPPPDAEAGDAAIDADALVDADGGASCPGGLGCPCQGPNDCDDPLCLETPSGLRCSTYCAFDACPAGWACQGKTAGADASWFCIADGGLTCRPCSADADCRAGGHSGARCVDHGDAGSFCGTACASTSDCAQGQQCLTVSSVQGGAQTPQCVPTPDADGNLGTCACSTHAVAAALETSCHVIQGEGATAMRCAGTRVCTADGLGPCVALTGAAASCVPAQCLLAGSGTAKAEGTPCDDGLPCSTGDACSAGLCQPASAQGCGCTSDVDCLDDGDLCNGVPYCDKAGVDSSGGPLWSCKINPATVVVCAGAANGVCQTTTCQPQTGTCLVQQAPAMTACDDGIACTTGDVCDAAGQCQSGTWTCCKSDADCAKEEDGDLCNGTLFCNLQSGACENNPATVVTCPTIDDTECAKATCLKATGQCALQPANVGLKCDDGNACSDLDTCDAKGACQPGKDTCPCTSDAECAAFDDGDLCNGTLYCNPIAGPDGKGVCRPNPKTVVVCPSVDDTFCKRNQCDGKTGLCGMVELPAQTTCDADGTACTSGDACDGKGSCVAGTVVCECQSDADCAAKEDGDLCNGTLFCDKGGPKPTCKLNPATLLACPNVDDTACQKNLCQPKTGQCVVQAVPAGAPCSDGEPCTGGDGCDGKGACAPGSAQLCGCKSDADCSGFDDGDLCNGSYVCAAGACAFTGKALLCDDGNPCTTDSCDPLQGCAAVPIAGCATCTSAGSCDDGNACTVESCVQGVCVGVPAPLPCDDGNPCTTGDTCKDAACAGTGFGSSCDDGDVCTLGDACQGPICKGSAAKVCDDASVCTADSCDAELGCQFAPLPDGVSCTSVAGGACLAGSCVGAQQCPAGYEPTLVGVTGGKKTACVPTGPVWGVLPDVRTGGFVLGPGGSAATTALDPLTKLRWQRGQAGQAPSGMTRAEAIAYCDALTLDGHEDWRLPTLHELLSAVDFAPPASGTALDSTVFVGGAASAFLTESVGQDADAKPWAAILGGGSGGNGIYIFRTSTPLAVRCVRTEGYLAAGKTRWVVSSEGEQVSDAWTGRTWRRAATYDEKGTLAQRAAFCASLTLGGATSWRLPTAREALSLVVPTAAVPWHDATAFPSKFFVKLWTTTQTSDDASKTFVLDMWNGSFTAGPVDDGAPQGRCVRVTGP
jgi:hypothetical protein